MASDFTLISRLTKRIEENELFNSTYSAHCEAWVTAMCELLNIDGNYTAEGLGIFAFQLDRKMIEENLERFPEEQIKNFCNSYNIDKNDLITMMQVIFEVFRNSSALSYAESELTPEMKKEEFGYRRFDNYVVLKKEQNLSKEKIIGDNRHSLLPLRIKQGNLLTDYIKRVTKIDDMDKICEFLQTILFIADGTGIVTCSEKNNERLYQIEASKYILNSYKKIDFYKCPICHKITQYNANNVCPTKFCKGVLCKCNPDEELKDSYYRKEYMTKNIEKIVVKEHTAQLDKDKAREYQRDFKRKKINVLSCSTTFEMGVDIGKLENVFMRNVPPTPANYVQRAGRAGRRNDSSAFVLTFCGASSHDYTYFEDPSKMIAGHIMPPSFKVTNDKIILRHLTAAALGFFFSQNSQYYENVGVLIENSNENQESGINKFKEYLKSKPEYLKEYIDKYVLDKETIGEYGNYKWIDKILDKDSNLETFLLSNLEKIKELESERDRAFKENEKSDYYSGEIKKIKNSEVINSLSSFNVIPKYGFPVDVVELRIYDKKGLNSSYDLSRDLAIAISEYAPDSEIIVDNKKFTSRYILKPKSYDELSKYYYYECEACERINVGITPESIRECKYCHIHFDGIINQYFIEPRHGFATDRKNKESTTKKPKKTYSGEHVYLGGGETEENKISFNDYIVIETSKNDELLVMNTNPFYRCKKCGYTKLNKMANGNYLKKNHENVNGYECPEEILERVSLGYKFKTDVVKIRIVGLVEKKRALSVLYAILEGISGAFDIERRDINGVVNKTEDKSYELIIFDNVPGGAGYVKRIFNQKGLELAFNIAYKKVDMNCCDEETSCYNCLRNYNNQRVHKDLKRRLARETLRDIINNISSINKNTNFRMAKAINYNESYSLEGYDSWIDARDIIDEIDNIDDYLNNNIKLADYSDAIIRLPNNKKVQAILLWKNENIIIVSDETSDEELEEFENYNITAFRKSKIEFIRLKEIIEENR